tara:strand:- start:1286 stop:1858 length:573 start_codon:yes stop_codon:yes gene_type:complete
MSEEKRILQMVAPNDPRLLSKIAPFVDDTLKENNFKDREELATSMYDTMKKYGGLGLSCNQVGLPYRMFVMGGHPQIDAGRVRNVFNPEVVEMSKETVMMKEGCLSFPFIFLAIRRPKWVEVKYEDEEGKVVQEHLHGMVSRIFQHENEHMNGYIFKDLVSDFKWKRAQQKAKKDIDKILKRQKDGKTVH